MNSIQRRLTVIVLATTLAMLLIAGGALFGYVRFALLHQLDRSMDSQARVLSSTIRTHLDGRLTLEADEAAIAPRRGGRPPKELFEVCKPEGTVLLRSASLGNSNITPDLTDDRPFGFDVTLPDGRSARVHRLRFTPIPDDDDPRPASAAAASTALVGSTPLIFVLAHDREEIDETLRTILTSLLLTALLLSAAICIIIPYAVRRGLLPLRQIATTVEQIQIDSLDNRFSPGQMPAEIAPICNRLNELMTRLHHAFNRERRFSADVAHELRTPIAELRAMAEVALRWPPDASAAARSFRETLDVAKQMEAVVTTLLTIARCEAGVEAVRSSTFDVNDAIADAWAPHQSAASAQGLEMDWQLHSNALITTDRTMLVQALSNLFSNAVAYTARCGKLSCGVEASPQQTEVMISNLTHQLTVGDLPTIFEPFWRKDASRTDSSRSGLGLSIVASYARVLGIELQTSLNDGRFSVIMKLPSAASASAPDEQPEAVDKAILPHLPATSRPAIA